MIGSGDEQTDARNRTGDAAPVSETKRVKGPRTPLPRHARVLFAGIFLSVASNNLFTPLLPDIQRDTHSTTAAIGAFVASYGLARLIIDLPAGGLTSRFGTTKVVVTGVILNAGSSALGLLATSIPYLVATRIGSGLGAGLVATVGLAALSDIAPSAIRGRVMSLYQVANNLGIAVYPLLGGSIGAWLGWRAAYLVAAVLSLASGLVLAPVLKDISSAAGRSRRELIDRGPALAPRAMVYAMSAIFIGVVISNINRHGFRNTVLPLFAADDVGLNSVQTATGITVMSLVSILVTIPGAALGDRVGRRRIIICGFAIVAVADAVFPVISVNYAGFLIAAVLAGAGDFFASSQTALLAELSHGPRRVLALSAYRFCVDLGALAGPVLIGSAFGYYGIQVTMLMLGSLLLLAAVLTLIAIPRRVSR